MKSCEVWTSCTSSETIHLSEAGAPFKVHHYSVEFIYRYKGEQPVGGLGIILERDGGLTTQEI